MKRNLLINIAIIAIYVIVSLPVLTGIGFHEWAGMGLFVVLVVHCAVHVDWAMDAIKGVRAKRSLGRCGNLALDIAIMMVFAVVTVSGLGISGAVLPMFGLFAPGYYVWNPLHAVAAKLLFALLVVHIAVHWRWVKKALSKKGAVSDGR